ncbi:MAG: hypothetical protein HC853_12220 [Anaerolineae bacterium]|nr:hypothetical protein [Anaerolineae bacterium]
MSEFLRSKILGGVYGQALGDAFCMPALLTPQQTRRKYGRKITTLLPAPDDHEVHVGLPAGRVTDDTEQALFLARQVISDGKVTLEGAAKAIVAWYDFVDGDHVLFVGPSTPPRGGKNKSGRRFAHDWPGRRHQRRSDARLRSWAAAPRRCRSRRARRCAYGHPIPQHQRGLRQRRSRGRRSGLRGRAN